MREPPLHLSKAWVKLLTDLHAEARKMGATDPQIYIEGNSGLVVMDGPPHDETTGNFEPRHGAVLFIMPWPRGMQCGVGAW